MSNICKPNCVTVLPNFGSIDQCDITALLSSGEITNVIFAKCNETFDDEIFEFMVRTDSGSKTPFW